MEQYLLFEVLAIIAASVCSSEKVERAFVLHQDLLERLFLLGFGDQGVQLLYLANISCRISGNVTCRGKDISNAPPLCLPDTDLRLMSFDHSDFRLEVSCTASFSLSIGVSRIMKGTIRASSVALGAIAQMTPEADICATWRNGG